MWKGFDERRSPFDEKDDPYMPTQQTEKQVEAELLDRLSQNTALDEHGERLGHCGLANQAVITQHKVEEDPKHLYR